MLKYRQKTRRVEAVDADAPYGIRIYELLTAHTDAGGPVSVPVAKKRRVTRPLLAQKYKPRDFFDLLGNDDANRQILRWLTLWERAIAGTVVPGDDVDELGRPLHKILLLSGPPGAGKTTAAHISASQKGFQVFEVNASDERGSAVVKDKIHTALGSHLVNTRKPVCIVADEIDGAAEHGFVRALLNIVNSGTRTVKKKGGSGPLMRPIIAICNDLYAPALHALRPICEIVRFERHSPALLIRRLERICRAEGLPMTTKELTAVTARHQCDLRACLNDIQFSSKSSVGSLSTDPYTLAKQQFESKLPVPLAQLETCADHDKLLDGLFAACGQTEYVDDMLRKPSEFADFLLLADSRADVKGVVAHAFGYYFRAASVSGKPVNVTTGSSARYEARKRTGQIAQQVLTNASTSIRCSTSQRTAVLELLPFLSRIACPLADRGRQAALALREGGVKYKHANDSLVLEPPIELAAVFDEKLQKAVATGQFLVRAQGLEVFRARAPPATAPAAASKPQVYSLAPANVTPAAEQGPQKVWVQYSEGFSNAVRKPVTWNELFGPL